MCLDEPIMSCEPKKERLANPSQHRGFFGTAFACLERYFNHKINDSPDRRNSSFRHPPPSFLDRDRCTPSARPGEELIRPSELVQEKKPNACEERSLSIGDACSQCWNLSGI
ncbi:hypothetical protein AVEN_15960-1 [Araneus ventricosus]|uniref:Uncharacterized protein n=1 Tax=Araneus ventricosus TaxID=182803 RepID=A0A4Y2IF44_ARAVE|nr:hypothetical protein AVEN_15960-1 [Araneus ventricosus]